MLSPLPAHSHKHPNTHHHAIILSVGKWCAYALARSARRSNATVVRWTGMVVALVCARFYYCCANNDRRHQIEVGKYAARKCAARMLAIACVQNNTAMAMTAEYCTRMRKVLAGCVFFFCVLNVIPCCLLLVAFRYSNFVRCVCYLHRYMSMSKWVVFEYRC